LEQNYAIMFADLAGSTSLYDTLGNVEADRRIRCCIDRLTSLTNKHRGKLIKTIGDEIMASFEQANDAIDAAVEMHKTISGDGSDKLAIRVGIGYGPAIMRDGDLFGDAVNVAARMTEIAQARHIITTEDCVAQLSSDRRNAARHYDQTRVKGKEAELNIYQVTWEDEGNQTLLVPTIDMSKLKSSSLAIVLMYNGQEKLVTDKEMTSAISIGRDASCDLSLETDFASRSHVDIKLNRGKFVLSDHSTNGTYVRFKGQDDIFIRREEMPLMGEGSISLGEVVDENNPSLIKFIVLQN
jgi:class 3 adenylate cyclase